MREKMNNMAVPSRASVSRVAAALALIAGSVLASGAHAQQHSVTPKQRATAQQVASRGVPASRMKTISYGKERPVAVCDDISCWSQNRRAVTVLGGAGM